MVQTRFPLAHLKVSYTPVLFLRNEWMHWQFINNFSVWKAWCSLQTGTICFTTIGVNIIMTLVFHTRCRLQWNGQSHEIAIFRRPKQLTNIFILCASGCQHFFIAHYYAISVKTFKSDSIQNAGRYLYLSHWSISPSFSVHPWKQGKIYQNGM
jgi:hypothetical protein